MEATTPTVEQPANRSLPSSFQSSRESNPSTISLGWLVIAGAIILALAPLVYQHCVQMIIRPHYQFFPLAIVGAIVLAVVRWRESRLDLVPGSSALTVVAFGLSVTTLLAAELLYSSWLGSVAALLTLASIAYVFGGTSLVWRFLPALVLLSLVIPPPFELDRQIILSLKAITTQWSSRVLDYVGLRHNMAGNVVEIPGARAVEQLLVEDACSGINSFFSIAACTVFLVFFYRRHWVHALLLIPSAFAWVLAANVTRVVTITICKVWWGVDLSHGWRHETLGVVVFLLAFGMVWSTDRFLLFLFAPSEPKEASKPSEGEDHAQEQVTTRLPAWVCSSPKAKHWLLGGLYVLILVLHFGAYGFLASESWPNAEEAKRPMVGVTAEELPKTIGGWNQMRFQSTEREAGSAFGELSSTWTYEKRDLKAIVSVDYPFPNWHDLTRCYTSQGWVLLDERVHEAGEKHPIGFVEVEMKNSAAQKGYLLYGQFNLAGKGLNPRKGGMRLSPHRHASALQKWMSLGSEVPRTDPPAPVYQFQVFVKTYRPLTAEDRKEVEVLYLATQEHLLRTGRWN